MITRDDPRLTAYVLDELSANDRAEVEQALTDSPELRQTVDELRQTQTALVHAFEHLLPNLSEGESIELSENQRQLIASNSGATMRIEAATAPVAGRYSEWRILAVAALVLYAATMTLFVYQRDTVKTERVSQVGGRSRVLGHDLLDDFNAASNGPEVRSPTAGKGVDGEHELSLRMNRQNMNAAEPELRQSEMQLQNLSEDDVADFVNPEPVPRSVGVGAPGVTHWSAGFGGGESMGGRYGGGGAFGGGAPEGGAPYAGGGQYGGDYAYRGANNAWDFDGDGYFLAYGRDQFAANPNYFLAYGRDQFAANPNVWYDRYDTQATLRPVEGAVGARFRHYSGVEQGLFNNAEFEESDRVELKLDVAQEQLQEVMKQKLSRITPSPTPTTAPAKSWKPAAAQPNAARITVGAQADLPLCAMDTYVRIDGFRARVMIDYYFFNDHAQQLEGSFLMRLPDDASLNYFAFGPTTIQQSPAPPSGDSAKAAEASVPAVDLNEIAALLRKQAAGGQSADLARRAVDDRFTSESDSLYGKVKAARVVERERAALAYEETARRRVDPALVEWAGAGIFQTRVFPLLPHTLNRVVIGYDTTLQWVDKTWKLKLQVPKHAAGHVEVDLAAIGGHQVQVSPSVAPFLSGDRAYYRFDVSKYPARKVEQEKQAADADGKEPPEQQPEQQLAVYEVTIGAPDSLMLTGQDKSGPYFVVQATADVQTESAVPFPDGRAVFLLDTSWSERPEQFARWLKLLAAILTENRESLRQFQVVLFNVEQRSWRTGWVENNAAIQQELMQELESTVLEGATNLTDALAFAVQLGKAEPKSEPSAAMPLLLLSDGAANWGKTDLQAIVAAVRGETTNDLSENACTVYAYRLQGYSADTLVLNKLVETTAGTLITVADGEEATIQQAARAVSERPWRIAKITADGATDFMLGSGSTSVHAGQRLMITGRGNPTGPITLTLTRGDQTQSVQVQSEQAIASPLAARTFGEVAVGRFESLGEQSAELAVAYARNFRVPGRTCSLVMLETDADYQRYGIKDDDDALVVRTTDAGAETERILADQGEERANSKAMFIRWIERLQDAPQPLLTMPTALSMYLRQQHDDAFEIALQRLQTKVTSRDEINAAYAEMLKGESLDASMLYSEAERRLVKYSAADAIKVLSTLLEERPGDIDVNRSLAFAALQWQRPDQAAALFQRVLFARPYQPQTLLLLAQCYAELGQEAAAVACYELVLHGTWHDRWRSVIQVAEFEEHALLRRLVAANAIESLPGRAFLTARLEQLNAKLGDRANDLAVVMYWNTDRTDVDLHVTDPSGEECFYSHPQTVAGGVLPFDITQGLGPELFTQAKTPNGNYQIKAKYYSSDNMRLGAPTMLYTRVYQPAAKSSLDVTSKLLLLSTASEEIAIATVNRSEE